MTLDCCEEAATELKNGIIEFAGNDFGWCVPGCCGGGCFVLARICFCPFCGAELPTEETYEVPSQK